MPFHSWLFAGFFLAVYGGYLLLKNTRLRMPWLLAASYVFFAWWNLLFVLLIAYSTVLDYVVVVLMDKTRWKKPWLALSVANNLALLGLFKYAGFLTETLNGLLGRIGVEYAIPEPGLLLPIGISFYVFQSLSYTIDFYRGRMQREPSLVRFATFVAFFPQLVAGPIERAKDLLPQFHRPARITREDVAEGLWLVLTGLFKKLALAGYLALYVDQVYGMPDMYEAPALVLATVAFAWQFYFEFSGYTDMARGVARLFGYRLTLNFNRPYLATDLGDFWRRWHISLSSWFHDYVYIPMGGSRTGRFRAAVTVLVTMVLAGLWYGAGWTFVIWGLLHAVARVITQPIEKTTLYQTKIPKCVKQLLVFAFVCVAWIFFRAPTLGDAWTIIHRIATSGLADPRFPIWAALLTGFVWAYQAVSESRWKRLVEQPAVRITLIVFMATYLALFASGNDDLFTYFLYFKF